MPELRRIGLVGGGVIGAGWAARFLLAGHDVAIHDPDPAVGRKLGEVLANARRAQARLMSGLQVPEGRLRIAASVEDAVGDADFVQESLPEREELKRRVLAAIDRAARPDVPVASSTSGLLPSKLQADMAHPERLLVGHPFNPVYLLPLVEICGGARTSDGAKAAAAELYESVGMKVLRVRREIDGFIADRLLEALWREALWLVHDGIATTAEVDDAIRYGAGLRWSFMGTFLTYRIAGGEAGMRHFMEQFGPALRWPWTKLTDVPELTAELVERVAAQSDAQAGGSSVRDLERLRDDCLVAVIGGLRAQDYGAGAVAKAHERRLFDRMAAAAAGAADDDGPLRLRTRVAPDWADYNGHMTESRYLQVFGEATDALLRRSGMDAAYLGSGRSVFTVETHIVHKAELPVGAAIRAETQVLAFDGKRLHLFHALVSEADGALAATGEQMLLHVDTAAGRAVPAQGRLDEALRALAARHAALARPPEAGRHVGMAHAA